MRRCGRTADLAATVIRAALDQVPELDVADIEDLMLGCGYPAASTAEVALLVADDHHERGIGTSDESYCCAAFCVTPTNARPPRRR